MLLLLVVSAVAGCENKSNDQFSHELRSEIDSLRKEMAFIRQHYKPGFGQAMVKIGQHHLNLWIAADDGNWERAAFEAHEIREGLEKLEILHNTKLKRPLTEMIEVNIAPALRDLNSTIEKKDRTTFRGAYDQLTASCNHCHREAGVDFLTMKRPTR